MIGRQSKILPKTRFHCLLDNMTYDWLDAEARARGLSIAAVLNEKLRDLRECSTRNSGTVVVHSLAISQKLST